MKKKILLILLLNFLIIKLFSIEKGFSKPIRKGWPTHSEMEFQLALERVNNCFDNEDRITYWEIKSSFRDEVFCFTNIMLGDEFYTRFYKKEYKNIRKKLTPEVEQSIKNLHRIYRVENRYILSALLSQYFSNSTDENLTDLIKRLKKPESIKEKLIRSDLYDDKTWSVFQESIPDLIMTWQFLDEVGFYANWSDNILPKINGRIDQLYPEVNKFNIIQDIENVLGFRLPGDTISVYLLYFNKPHSFKIEGNCFLTNYSYSTKIIMNDAVHELVHTIDFSKDEQLASALESLKQDKFLMDKFRNHNPSFGYNTFEGYVEENCVRALDERINRKYGFTKFNKPKKRWKKEDDGMHVLAMAIYYLMEKEHYDEEKETFKNFFLRMIHEDKLIGKIEKIYNRIY